MKREDYIKYCDFLFEILNEYLKIMNFKSIENVFDYVKEHKDLFENKKNSLLESKLYVDNDYKRVLRMNLGLVGNELKNIQDFNFMRLVCIERPSTKTVFIDITRW